MYSESGNTKVDLKAETSVPFTMPNPDEDNVESEVVTVSESDGDEEDSIIITMNDITGETYDSEIRWEFDNEIEAGHYMISSMLSAAEGAQFREISGGFGDLTIQAYTIYYFRQKILETIENTEIRDSEGGKEVDIRQMKLNLREEMIVFYTSSSAVIEDLCVQLIIDILVPDERKSKSVREDFEYKRQKERERLLYNFGVIGEGTKGEIREVMRTRNSLLHNPGKRTYLNKIKDIRAEIDRTTRVLDRLHSMIFEDDFSSRLGMWAGDLDFLR